MYIQLTTRCNMTCAHCCMDATEEGQDITLQDFEAALALGDEYATLGGGEPTLHAEFEKLLMLAIARTEHTHIITNGKETERALLLAKLARKCVIGADLSQDSYHEPIEDIVVEAFTKEKQQTGYTRDDADGRGIRNVTGREINAGRCDFSEDYTCACEDPFICANGDLKPCGCLDAPVVAHVRDADAYEKLWNWYEDNGVEHGECWRGSLQQEEATG